MTIAGLQKMTLLDFPGRVACTVFLPGCNFRCPYCHNSGLIAGGNRDGMTEEELLSFLKGRRGLLDGVCITGGEPTLSPGLPRLLEEIRALGFAVKLDTNGSRPDVLEAVLPLVDYVAMDVKSSPDGYGAAIGLEKPPMGAIEDSLRLLMNSGKDYELRITLVQELHGNEEITRLGQWLYDLNSGEQIPKLFLQLFVNRDSVLTPNLHAPENHQISHFAELLSTFVREVSIRG
jgi:pyruvate formate lyase activating enzyme